MKWWDRIVERFQRGIEEEDLELEWDGSSIESWDWETLLKDRDMLKMTDDYERQKFIRSCVDQLNTSSGQLEQRVTSGLKATSSVILSEMRHLKPAAWASTTVPGSPSKREGKTK